MANLKFSQFQEQTDPANVQFVVGYNGTDNVRIDPVNLAPAAPVDSVNTQTGAVSLGLTDLNDVGADGTNGQVLTTNGSGSFTFADAGGGGATDLNGLTDVLIDGDSAYFINIPAGLSGNPAGNIIIGSGAANSMTTATENVVIGVNALANDSGDSNANENVIIGYGASQTSVTQVQAVVAIGFEASKANGNAFGGTHIGWKAADSTSSKYRSTSVGALAMSGSATAQDSVAIGYTASGFSTGNINGSTTVGYEAGSRSDAAQTTLIGYQASKDNQAAGVVSLGYQAGFSQTSGASNTNIGYQAGYSTTTGTSNTTLGHNALDYNNGNNNVAIGTDAMKGSTSFTGAGADNVAIGYNAGSGFFTGTTFSNSILIGKDAATSPSARSNFIVLGNSSQTTLQMPGITAGASNGDVLMYDNANFPFNSLKLYPSGTTPSDARDKKDIEDLPYGLEFINSLKPRKYIWDNRAKIVETESFDEDGNPITITEEFVANEKGTIGFGFIAQELQEVDNEVLQLVNDYNEDSLRINYSKLVPVLVKAIQELKAEIELLK